MRKRGDFFWGRMGVSGPGAEPRNLDSNSHFGISDRRGLITVLQLTQQKHFMNRTCFLVIELEKESDTEDGVN